MVRAIPSSQMRTSHDRMTMLFRHACAVSLALGWACAIGAAGPTLAEGLAQAAPQPDDVIEGIRRQPMIFFVAKGEVGACGAGCSEWIAAEGAFDGQAHSRLRQFLDTLPRKDLPIFFHSMGGLLGPSVAMGVVLRANRMRAGVGHTIPIGCRDTLQADEACRKLMQSGREHQARLRESGAICASSCVYALLGASTRIVAYVARVGVHGYRAVQGQGGTWPDQRTPPSRPVVVDRLKQYASQMGVDFGLVELAEATSPRSMHWLSRDEIARFGVATSAPNETRWLAYTRPGVGFVVTKSVTRPSRLNPAEYRTASVEFACSFVLGGLTTVLVRRDLDRADAEEGAAVRLISGETVFLDSERRSGPITDIRATAVPAGLLAQAGAADGLLLEERSETWSRETRFSAPGLSDALKLAPEECREKD
jgi:hypothetical protein